MHGGNGGNTADFCRFAGRARAEPYDFDHEGFGFRIVKD